MRIAIVLATVGCATQVVSYGPKPAPRETWCSKPLAQPPLDPAFVPSLTGDLALVDARGDARLSAPGRFRVAWSADGALLAFTGDDGVTVYRASDGTVVEHVSCPRALHQDAIAFVDDTIIVTGEGVSCIVDRAAHTARIVDGAVTLPPPPLPSDTWIHVDPYVQTANVDLALFWAWPWARVDGDLDDDVTRPPPSGAAALGLRDDLALRVPWTDAADKRELWERKRRPAAPPFHLRIAASAGDTDHVLWRDTEPCCTAWDPRDPQGWWMADDDRIRAAPTPAPWSQWQLVSEEQFSNGHGAIMGYLLSQSPRGEPLRIAARGARLARFPNPVEPAHQLPTVARAGTIAAVVEDGRLVVEDRAASTCIAVDSTPPAPGAFARWSDVHYALSSDGRYLYAGFVGDDTTSWAETWRTDTGARVQLVRADAVARTPDVAPEPEQPRARIAAGGRVEVIGAGTVQLVDDHAVELWWSRTDELVIETARGFSIVVQCQKPIEMPTLR